MERVLADFSPLNVRSNYSFLSKEAAVSSPGKLFEALAKLGYIHGSVADRTLYAEGRVFQAAATHGLSPIPGLRFSIPVDFGAPQEGIILPKSLDGLRRLHRFHSLENMEHAQMTPSILRQNTNYWYAILMGPLPPRFRQLPLEQDEIFLGIRSPLDKIDKNPAFTKALMEKNKVVAVPEVRMAYVEDARKLSWLARVREDALAYAPSSYAVPFSEDIRQAFESHIHAVGLSREIVNSIHVDMPSSPEIVLESVKPGWTPEAYLRHLALQLTSSEEKSYLRERVLEEVRLMTAPEREGFASVVFLVKETMDMCKKNHIPVKTTGSANNSVLLSLLGITQLAPDEAAECDFDRFLNEQRLGKPDIDMEVGFKDRERILTYLREKYGLRATEIIVAHTMGIQTISNYARLTQNPLTPEEMVALSQEHIPFSVKPHDSKVVLIMSTAYTHAGERAGKSKIMAELDRVDVEKIFDYAAMDFLPRQGPQRLHITAEFARRRHVVVPKVEGDQLVMRRIFSGDTMGIADAESPHMQHTLQRIGYHLQRPERRNIADAIAISKPRRELRERFLSHSRGEEGIISKETLEKLGLTRPVLYQQEDLAHVAKAAGFSLEEQERVRKMLSDKDVSIEEKKEIIKVILQGLKEHGFDSGTLRELGNQMESYVGYILVRGHALSLAHGVEESARYAVYDPVGFYAGVLTTVATYADKSDYPLQAYINDALRHRVTLDFATKPERIPEEPEIWRNKIAVSKTMLQAGFGGKLTDDFYQRYLTFMSAFVKWKKGEGTTQDLLKLQWEMFYLSFTHNPLYKFDRELWFDPQRNAQEAIVQPIARTKTSDNERYLLTLDAGEVIRTVLPVSLADEHILAQPFWQVRLVRNNSNGGLDIKNIIATYP